MALPVASFGGFAGRGAFSKDYNSVPPQRHMPCNIENSPVLRAYPTCQNAGAFDVKRMLEGMRQTAALSPHAAYCPQENPHTATLKRKLAMRGKQLKAAKRKITAVSQEKAGLEQQLALREQKLQVVMAAKDIYLNLNVEKTLYHDVMGPSASGDYTNKKRPRVGGLDQHPAIEFVDRVSKHLGSESNGSRNEVVMVTSSWEQDVGCGRKLALNVDFWRTPGPIVVRDEVFQVEPMTDFLGGLAEEHGSETVVSKPDGMGGPGEEEGETDAASVSSSSGDESGYFLDDEEDDWYGDEVEQAAERHGCRVLSGGKLGVALETLLAAYNMNC